MSGGTAIVSQNANGVVFVAATTVPVLVRANFDQARIWGVEHSGHFTLAEPLSLQTVFTYLRAKDTLTGLSPNIEGGTPAPEGGRIQRAQADLSAPAQYGRAIEARGLQEAAASGFDDFRRRGCDATRLQGLASEVLAAQQVGPANRARR